MSRPEHIFVFVVCGAREHIEALHYSLQALHKYSLNKVLVITDPARNEIPVQHTDVIEVNTPAHLDHHQASIYLKTGIHRFLPKGPLYCYLDTDVVALDAGVDGIFAQYESPITFAKDHCVMDRFSPHAVKCGCATKEPARKTEVLSKIDGLKNNKLHYAWISLRFMLSGKTFKLDANTFFDKEKKYWHDQAGVPIVYDWTDATETIESRCNHLQQQILETFSIDVTEPEWQHWNGGVFLFDDSSHDFLDAWHEKTMHIFTLPYWKTRDQGTLIATAWEFGLSRHKLLDQKFNLICDYNNKHIKHLGGLKFRMNDNDQPIEPCFIHVYHHWADKKWDVWQAVEKRTGFTVNTPQETIHSLWIGDKLSKLELLTIKSFLANGHTFKLWVYEPIRTPLPENLIIGDASTIIPRDQVFAYKNSNKYGHGKGSYAGFSDIFRYKLLYEEGGWWVDMDVACLKPFDTTEPYFFRTHHEMPVVGNVMKCPKHSELMRLCYEEAVASVNEQNTDWHKPVMILNKHIAALHLDKYVRTNVSNQDQWDHTVGFVSRSYSIPADWYFVHWQNEEWRSRNISREDFYYKSALSMLLQKYNLYTAPASGMGKFANTLRHFSYFQ